MSEQIKFHPDYYTYVEAVEKSRTFLRGEEAVKLYRETYLPSPGDAVDYDNYLKGSVLYEVFGYTVAAYLGMLFRKEVDTQFKKGEGWLANTDGSGKEFKDLLREIGKEILAVGRIGALVDADAEGETYIVTYNRESILSWKEERGKLTYVLLREDIDEGDEFEVKMATQYRRLFLRDGVYVQQVVDKNKAILEEVIPTTDKGTLEYIPFVFFNHDSNTADTVRPPLMSLVNLSEAHFHTWADLRHAERLVGVPQSYSAGFTKSEIGDVMEFGPGVHHASENASAKIEILQAPICAPLVEELNNIEQRMKDLGAHLLSDAASGETATAVRMRTSAQSTLLASIAKSLSRGGTRLLRYVNDFLGETVTSEIYVKVSEEFYPSAEVPAIADIIKGWLDGAYTQEVMLKNLVRMDLITKDDIKAIISQTTTVEGNTAETQSK